MLNIKGIARNLVILGISLSLIVGCALEPKIDTASKTTGLTFSLPQPRTGSITVHYLLYPWDQPTANLNDSFPAFITPIDTTLYQGSQYIVGVVPATSATDNYTIPIEGVTPRKVRLRIHVFTGTDPNQYYWGYDSSGTWVITDSSSINYYDVSGNPDGKVWVYESDNYFDVIAGQTTSIACTSVVYWNNY